MPGRRIAAGSGRCDPGIKNLPAFRLFIDLLAGEGGHRAIKALLAKSVTHVFGINRNPCVRNGPLSSGRSERFELPTPGFEVVCVRCYINDLAASCCNGVAATSRAALIEYLRRRTDRRHRR